MPTFADAQDVADAFEGTLEIADPRLVSLLQTANARLAAMIPALSGWIAAGLVDESLARDVVVRALLARYRNPTGSATVSEAAGPFNVNYNYGSSASADLFAPADLALLYPPRAGRTDPIPQRPPLDFGVPHRRRGHW